MVPGLTEIIKHGFPLTETNVVFVSGSNPFPVIFISCGIGKNFEYREW